VFGFAESPRSRGNSPTFGKLKSGQGVCLPQRTATALLSVGPGQESFRARVGEPRESLRLLQAFRFRITNAHSREGHEQAAEKMVAAVNCTRPAPAYVGGGSSHSLAIGSFPMGIVSRRFPQLCHGTSTIGGGLQKAAVAAEATGVENGRAERHTRDYRATQYC
jgi:hypothetical protein